jgi:hypothetical protein
MKKLGLLILLLSALALTLASCGGTPYAPRMSAAWRYNEKLTYEVSVTGDDVYAYAPDGNLLYPVKPDPEKSFGEYTTEIVYDDAAKETAVILDFTFFAVYPASAIVGGVASHAADAAFPHTHTAGFICLKNTMHSEVVYSGTSANPLGAMISSHKEVDQWTVNARKQNGAVTYTTPERLHYDLDGVYGSGAYTYTFDVKPDSVSLSSYGIAADGSIDLQGGPAVDNEALGYYFRAVEITPANYTQIALTVSVPDPFTNTLSKLQFGGGEKVTLTAKGTFRVPVQDPPSRNLSGARFYLAAAGEQTGHPIYLYYALEDLPAIAAGSHPTRRKQKLICMRQAYIQYDLIDVVG